MEMKSDALTMRMLGSQGRINMREMLRGHASQADMEKLRGAVVRVAKAPICVDETSGLSIGQIRARARRMVQRLNTKMIVVDYLQLAHAPIVKGGTHEQAIATISTGLKQMAKELNVPVVCVCQLSRDFEREPNRKPRMSDIKASGQIEQDSDFIGILYREKSDDDPGEFVPVNLMVCKQRNGDAGMDIRFLFHKKTTRFLPASKIDAPDMPQQQSDLGYNNVAPDP
jgi:replicative DNA helicase